jgi:hypothetical protein
MTIGDGGLSLCTHGKTRWSMIFSGRLSSWSRLCLAEPKNDATPRIALDTTCKHTLLCTCEAVHARLGRSRRYVSSPMFLKQ